MDSNFLPPFIDCPHCDANGVVSEGGRWITCVRCSGLRRIYRRGAPVGARSESRDVRSMRTRATDFIRETSERLQGGSEINRAQAFEDSY